MNARQQLLLLVLAMVSLRVHAASPSIEWTRQTAASYRSSAVDVDGLGNVYIAGQVLRSSGTVWDSFVSKYDAGGNLLWTQQSGRQMENGVNGVAVDGCGNAFTAGWIDEQVEGWMSDVSVSKYAPTGDLLWEEQLAGELGFGDGANAIAVDYTGNVYVSGNIDWWDGFGMAGSNGFLSKYDVAGNLLWTELVDPDTSAVADGESFQESNGVAIDGLGNVYISGYTYENPVGSVWDAFVSKYNAQGTLLWTEQYGTAEEDFSSGIAADGFGNVYITGWTQEFGVFTEVFVSKYNGAGDHLWSERRGTAEWERSSGVTTDGLGNVYVIGDTGGNPAGPGNSDVFVSKYDALGTLLWNEQIGTAEPDRSSGIATDGFGNIYITGWTHGSFGGPNAGRGGAFLIKLHDPVVPEPASCQLAWLAVLLGLVTRARKSSDGER